MKYKILYLFVFLLALACQQQKETSNSPWAYIPKTTIAIVKTGNLQGIKSDVKNNQFLKTLTHTRFSKKIENALQPLNYITKNTSGLLSVSEREQDSLSYTFILEQKDSIINLKDIPNLTSETITSGALTYTKYQIDNFTFYASIPENKVIISTHLETLKEVVQSPFTFSASPTLERLYNASIKNKQTTLYIQPKSIPYTSKTEDYGFSIASAADWIALDINSSQNQFSLNGVSTISDSIPSFLSLLKNTHPLIPSTPAYAPKSAEAINCFTFDNYDIFFKNKQKYLDKIAVSDTIFNSVEEISTLYLANNKAALIKTYASENIVSFLRTLNENTTEYQGTEIASLQPNTILKDYFFPLITNVEAKFYSIIDNTFIFTENVEDQHLIIGEYKSGNTFKDSALYTTVQNNISNEASQLFIGNAKEFVQLSKDLFSDTVAEDIANSSLTSYTFYTQVVADEDYYYTAVAAKKTGVTQNENSTSSLFKVELDADIATQPQFVKNHRNGSYEIVVQDIDLNLYLISNKGKVLWKKQLDAKINGKIQQVDLFKNRKLQLAFSTSNQFLILDRNGKEVAPFTKKYEGGNVNPLAVFDYDTNHNYRFVVTQGSNVFMYNNNGKEVSGFTLKQTESPIIEAPKHFRIGTKDYLAFKLENQKLKIYNRVGKDRIVVKDKIDFSSNEVYQYKNKFIVTDKTGMLHEIDTKGTIGRINFNLPPDHGIDATNNSLVIMGDNVIDIKGKKATLELGVYSKPKIFYLYDKIYVAVTDIQNQKIYVFDSQAKPIADFPVYGSSEIDMMDIDNDKKIEIVTKDLENSIVVYRIN